MSILHSSGIRILSAEEAREEYSKPRPPASEEEIQAAILHAKEMAEKYPHVGAWKPRQKPILPDKS